MKLRRPLCVFDLEATGTNPATDRIVQIGILYVAEKDGEHDPQATVEHHQLINPTIPIPAAATAIHGITNERVKGMPTFAELAEKIESIFKGTDLAGFNITGYDLTMLSEEFARAGIDWDPGDAKIIDAGNIFKKKHPRTLEAACRLYDPGKPKEEYGHLHNAMADAKASWHVLLGQLRTHPDLGAMTVDELAKFCEYDDNPKIDLAGKLARDKDGDAVYNFSKSKGIKVRNDIGFAYWMLDKDFPSNTKRHLRAELERIANEEKARKPEHKDDLPF